ncbi:glucose-6-phosphate dehydrogenase [Acidomonas methanolica]|nr:glucose-6-phosphate dehydrogenase [Acidomonas methanolica]MBU2654001.1 glucose-6-phosphate dehydrogenase [Acidomonas methanolica]GBQ49456.1 glucose-6-phosphate 1-dehydrogenase [Acidomonas methanolica]
MSDITPVKPFDYVIFGASGDLTMRKLLPAFYHRFRTGEVPGTARIIGVARSALERSAFQQRTREALESFVGDAYHDPETVTQFLELVHYVSLDAADETADWSGLSALLEDGRVRVFYFATAPKLYRKVCATLDARGLITPESRVVLEKPIGIDLRTAQDINEGVGRFFSEENIFRIDHYLGKETVQGVMALRFANPVLENAWSAEHISSVQITAAEVVGVEKRAAYYDTTGALRDMVQNHLLQVLSLVAMERPASLDADAVRDAKVAVLHALRPLTGAAVGENTVRAQYQAGEVKGEAVPGYLDELGHASTTETYAAVQAEIDTPRWKGVPFYLRTGKRLAEKVSEIVITFRPPEAGRSSGADLFPSPPRANLLVIRVQPDEGVTWRFNAKDPADDGFDLRCATMDVHFERQFRQRYPDAYERLLLDAVRGNPILFIRRDEVEAAWRWIEPILEGWGRQDVPMCGYPAGGHGPKEADDLLARHGDAWYSGAA